MNKAELARKCLQNNINSILDGLPYSKSQITQTGNTEYHIEIEDYEGNYRYIKINFAITKDDFDINIPLKRFELANELEAKRKAKRNGKD